MTESERKEWGRLSKSYKLQTLANIARSNGNAEEASDLEADVYRSRAGLPIISEEEAVYESQRLRTDKRSGLR